MLQSVFNFEPEVNLVPGIRYIGDDPVTYSPRYVDLDGNPVPEPFPPSSNRSAGSWSHRSVGRHWQKIDAQRQTEREKRKSGRRTS